MRNKGSENAVANASRKVVQKARRQEAMRSDGVWKNLFRGRRSI